jgi:hypothetical protein
MEELPLSELTIFPFFTSNRINLFNLDAFNDLSANFSQHNGLLNGRKGVFRFRRRSAA